MGEGKVDWRGRPAIKGVHGGVFPSLFVLVIYGLDTFASIALSMNMVIYLTKVMNFGIADASNTLTNFLGTSFILAVAVAFLADGFLGRWRAVLISTCIEFSGLVLLTVQAHFGNLRPEACNIYSSASGCKKVAGVNAVLLYCSLYSIALGMAGVKAGLLSHGADQFDEKDSRDARRLSSYFNWMMFSTCIGSAFSLSIAVWIQTRVGWDWGFGLSATASLLEALIFIAGIPWYRMQPVGGSTDPVTEITQVFVAAIRNRSLELPKNPKDLYEIHQDKESSMNVEFVPHRDMLRLMDKAAIRTTGEEGASPWKQCRVSQVEQAKTMVGMVPIFCCSILVSTCLAQIQTFTIQQALTLDNLLFGVRVPAASLSLLSLGGMMLVIPLYDRLVVPALRRLTGVPSGVTHLKRVGVGLVLAALSMAVAAVFEAHRKLVAARNGMLDATPGVDLLPLSMFWLTMQGFVFGMSDIFTYVGLQEFYYSEAPPAMKSIATAFLWLSLALGYFTSTVLVDLVNWATGGPTRTKGWLAGNNLNRNHLDLFYWLLAALTFINFFTYLYWAKRYKYKEQHVPTGDSKGGEISLSLVK